jgi:hypothetical protein
MATLLLVRAFARLPWRRPGGERPIVTEDGALKERRVERTSNKPASPQRRDTAPGGFVAPGRSVLLTLLLLGACRGPEPAEPGGGIVEAPDTMAPVQVVPVTFAETIRLEGMTESIQARLFETPVDFPLGFRTVVPTDLHVDFVSSGEGDAVRFEAAFGGVHNPEALLSAVVLPDRHTAEDAHSYVESLARELGAVPGRGAGWEWAEAHYDLQGPRSGFLALGQRNETWFYVLSQYPPEYGDGMAPRIELILRRWTWSDGTPLVPPGS